MPTTLAFKPLIDLPEWRPIANAPAASAAGTQLVAGLRNNSDRGAYVYMLVNATTLWAYDVEDDDWFQLASPALTGTFGAGAGAVMMPTQGPRGVLAGGNTTTSIVLSTALPAAVAPNQLANKGNSNGFKIRIIGNSAGGSGKTEHAYIIGNTGGTTPTIYLDAPLSFTAASWRCVRDPVGPVVHVERGHVGRWLLEVLRHRHQLDVGQPLHNEPARDLEHRLQFPGSR